MEVISALTLGLIGSFHCIGMCGPIAIALPLKNQSWLERIISALLYNLGRTVTYGIMGAVFGLLGKGFQLIGIQQWVSIIMGIIMILSVIFPIIFRKYINADGFVTKWVSKLISTLRKLFSKRSYISLWVIGLMNGLLPCGLVYVAIAGAINTNDIVSGAIYMSIFGIGTIPIMASIPIVGNLIGTNIRRRFKGVISIFIVILGILFILRGLSLGIPYISPPTKMLQPHEKTMNNNVSGIADDTITTCH